MTKAEKFEVEKELVQMMLKKAQNGGTLEEVLTEVLDHIEYKEFCYHNC